MKKTFLFGLFVILMISLFHFCYATDDGDVYISVVNSTTTVPNWYPSHGMNPPSTTTDLTDWEYAPTATMSGSFYIVPTGFAANGIFAARIQVHYTTNGGANFSTPVSGDALNVLYNAAHPMQFFTTPITNGWEINVAAMDLANHSVTDGKYLARVDFTVNKPIQGGNPFTIDLVDIRWYDAANNKVWSYAFVNQGSGYTGYIKYFLGDFTASTATDPTGDGLINSFDLQGFSLAYWGTMNGVSPNLYKYNIGPTADLSYYSAPNDATNVVDFEDLVIFAIGYGKSPGGLYVIPSMNNNPIEFSLGTYNSSSAEIRVPVSISGNVTDLRGFSLTANMSNMQFIRVEKQGALTGQTSLLFGKAEGNTVFVDAAVFDGLGIGMPGTVADIVLKPTGPKPSISLSTVKARNTNNESFTVKFGESTNSELPTSFGLNQNYPNPFNPSTMINYQIPKSAKVILNIYDINGKLVTTLVNSIQDAGKYSVEWKAGNNASGVYFYRINAGNFTDVKKMILEK